MNFDPDLNKQAEHVIFSKKIKRLFDPALLFSDIPLNSTMLQRHLGFNIR